MPIAPNYPDYRPYTNIQPFTVRDGATYLLQLEALKDWLRDYVIPTLNTEASELADNWMTLTTTLLDDFNAKTEALRTEVSEAVDEVGDSVALAQAAQAAAEAAETLAEQYASQAANIQDVAIRGIVDNLSSQTRALLDSVYASVSELSTVEGKADQANSDITGLAAYVDETFVGKGAFWIDPRDYGAVADGITDDTIAINAAIAEAESIVTGTRPNYWSGQTDDTPIEFHPAVYLSNGTYGISSTINVPQGVTIVIGPAASLKAISLISGAMIQAPNGADRTQFHTVVYGEAETSLIDCNNLAKIGVYIPYAIAARCGNFTVRDWTDNGGGVWVGRDSALDTDRSWEIMTWNINTWRTRNTGNGEGNPGDASIAMWYRNVSDSHIHKALLNGGEYGLRVDGENNDISFVHVWNTVDARLTTAFIGKKRSRWSHCFADSASAVGFDFSDVNSQGTVMVNCHALAGYATENTSVAVKLPSDKSFIAIGGQIRGVGGATGGKWGKAFDGLANQATIIGIDYGVSTIIDPSSRVETMGGFGIASKVHGLGLDVVDGSALAWPGNGFKGIRVSTPIGVNESSGYLNGGEDPSTYSIPANTKRVYWATPSNIQANPGGSVLGFYARSDGFFAIANKDARDMVIPVKRRVVTNTNYTAKPIDETIVCDSSLTVTLPNAESLGNIPFSIRVINRSSGLVAVTSPNGAPKSVSDVAPGTWREFTNDGSFWYGK